MAKTISELRNQSIQVRDASAAGENTATRVGTVLNDIVGHIEDYENTQSSNNSSQDAKIEGVKSSLNAEIARAKTEESNLINQIGTERTERQAAVSKEETARIQADNDEKTARENADNAEQDARIKADNDEKTARENADITLRTMIQTEVSNRQIAVKQEEIRAMAAEKANTQGITDENARATTEEERLQGEIDNTNTNVGTLENKVNSNHDHFSDEVARLDLTDNEIKADLEAETARAEAAEKANADNIAKNAQAITDETARAKAAEEAIIFDVSAHNNGAVFESISALLGNSNLDTFIPVSLRHGGMTIRFIQGSEQSSDNNYVQYRLMTTSWSNVVSDWQGVDDEPIAGSNNLVKSGGVADKISELGEYEEDDNYLRVFLDQDGRIIWGIKKDGDIFYGYGVPSIVVDLIEKNRKSIEDSISVINASILTLQSDITKIKEVSNSLEDSDSICAVVDSDNRVIEEITSNGEKVFYIPVVVEKQRISDVAEIETEALLDEYICKFTDNDSHIIYGIKKDGTVYVPQLESDVINKICEKIANLNKVIGIKELQLGNEVEVIFNKNNVGNKEVLFTSDNVPEGAMYDVFMVLSDKSCCIRFNDASGNRLSWHGYSNTEPGTVYKSTIKVPKGYKEAVLDWGGASSLFIYKVGDNDSFFKTVLYNLQKKYLDCILYGDVWYPEYFKDEMRKTIDAIDSLSDKPALVLPILTDSHIGTTARGIEQTYETIANVRYLCHHCYCDGVVHLGDLLSQSWNTILLEKYSNDQTLANKEELSMMQDYLMNLASVNKHLYAVNGNHDGNEVNSFNSANWYRMIGRLEDDDEKVIRHLTKAYFYVDYPKCNVRLIFLSQPDDVTFGYSEEQLNWLKDVAMNVSDGTNIIMFSHIPPFQAGYIQGGVLLNRDSLYGLCNAFNNHTTYSDSVVNCDFSGLSSSKIICYICGHEHCDKIYQVGESFDGYATNIDGTGVKKPWTYVNDMPCPVVILTNTFVGGGDGVTLTDIGGICVPRTDKTETQDAWTVMVYSPDDSKIHFVRFGSGDDREIDLNNLI